MPLYLDGIYRLSADSINFLYVFFINAGYLAENINTQEAQHLCGYLKNKAKLDKSGLVINSIQQFPVCC